MTKKEYLFYAIEQEYVFDANWFFTFFGIQDKEFKSNKYLIRNGNEHIVKLEKNKEEKLEKCRVGEPIYLFTNKIQAPKGLLKNLKSNVDTTVGRLLMNKILIDRVFGDRIEYINKSMTVKKTFDPIMAKGLANKTITVKEYIDWTNSVYFLEGLSKLCVWSQTAKFMTGPDKIKKIKAKAMKDLEKKYGKDWAKDRSHVAEFKKILMEADIEYLKDDPTFGKLASGSNLSNGRLKRHLTFGDEAGFDKKTGKTVFVPNSLDEKYTDDKEQLTAVFNAIRSASYDRGKETQKGGAATKDILRSTSSITITGDDCGSKEGKKVLVTKQNYKALASRYVIRNGKSVLFTDSDKYIGKEVEIRSPMYCNNKDQSFCKKCVGDNISRFPNISFPVIEVSSVLMHIAMKSMHNTQVSSTKYNITEELR